MAKGNKFKPAITREEAEKFLQQEEQRKAEVVMKEIQAVLDKHNFEMFTTPSQIALQMKRK